MTAMRYPQPVIQNSIETDLQWNNPGLLQKLKQHIFKSEHTSPDEFFIPQEGIELAPYLATKNLRAIHHLARYHWAIEVIRHIRPQRILDIACGSGYGSAMMAKAFPRIEVIGADYDPKAIQYASQHHRVANLSYCQADMVTWQCWGPSGEVQQLGMFDMIISFDTIEHLLHREIAFINLAEQLTTDGHLLFSTPCGQKFNRLNPGWEHHKIEYAFSDLGNLLNRFFSDIVSPDMSDFPARDFWDGLNREESFYLMLLNPLFCRKPIQFRDKDMSIEAFPPFRYAVSERNKSNRPSNPVKSVSCDAP